MWKLMRRLQLHINSTRWLIRNFRSGETREATGLYGFDHLKTAKGFQRFVADAIERSGELVDYISGMPTSPEVIKAMDEREFVEEANKAAMGMNDQGCA